MLRMKRLLIPALILLVLGLAAWAPWISTEYARQHTEEAFATSWQGVMDGCGLNCTGCGAVSAHKTWFGYQVEIEYACGLIPADTPEYHQRRTGFVSFLGTVHGFPSP